MILATRFPLKIKVDKLEEQIKLLLLVKPKVEKKVVRMIKVERIKVARMIKVVRMIKLLLLLLLLLALLLLLLPLSVKIKQPHSCPTSLLGCVH